MVGLVMLPNRPTTLGEARGGLEMVGGEERSALWLRSWVASGGDERCLLLRLPDGWFELRFATIAPLPGTDDRFVIRFEGRSAGQGPAV